MNSIINYLKKYQVKRSKTFFSSSEFYCITKKKIKKLIKIANPRTPSKVLISESNTTEFISSFLAAVGANCQVFLCNPKWGQLEWEKVLKLVEPDIILGKDLNSNRENKKDIPDLKAGIKRKVFISVKF